MAQYFFSPKAVLRKRKLSTRQLPNLPEYAANLRRKRPLNHTLANNQEMSVIYIHSERPHDLEAEGQANLIKKRKWNVSISVNKNAATSADIEDPFLQVDYKGVFEQYLRSSDKSRWNSQNLIPDQEDAIELAERRIEEYGRLLFDQLDKQTSLFKTGEPEAQIYVVEHHNNCDGGNGGIHCLAWELLESVEIERLPKLRLRVTRVSDFPALRLLQPPGPDGPRLAAIQANRNATFNILLVIARDFSHTGAERDPEPDLAQWPLMNLQKKLRSRLTLEIVRPGSLEELDSHLDIRAQQEVYFNLVHFDLHGRIMRNESGQPVPWLLFARQHRPSASEYSFPQTQLANAEAVAEVLSRHRVENVVLNACLSAYNRSGTATNLAHIFLRHGISNVSAMWYYVHWKTVQTYVEAFYDKLLIECLDFHVAAQRARESLRQQPTSTTERTFQDFFLCVNYARGVNRTDSMMREVSPSPSAKSPSAKSPSAKSPSAKSPSLKSPSLKSPSVKSPSVKSPSVKSPSAKSPSAKSPSAKSPSAKSHELTISLSNTSTRSTRSGIWSKSSSRFKYSFGSEDETILRLRLHLLELEYKLMTFRIIYASDLDQASSNLNGTLDKMVNMWLNTNLIDEVHYYKAKDFSKRNLISGAVSVSPRTKHTRLSHGRPLQRLFPRTVDSLRQTLHIVKEVDSVVDPGMQVDELENQRREERRLLAQEGLQQFASKLHEEGRSYMIFVGSQNAQWWRTYLQALDGEWWLNMPWSFTVHARFTKEI